MYINKVMYYVIVNVINLERMTTIILWLRNRRFFT